jgi:hypothetical protein
VRAVQRLLKTLLILLSLLIPLFGQEPVGRLKSLGKWPLEPQGAAWDFAVDQGFGYVATGDGLMTLDLRDRGNPQKLGLMPSSGASQVAVEGGVGWLVTGLGRFNSVDLSDRDHPRVTQVTDPPFPLYGIKFIEGLPYGLTHNGDFNGIYYMNPASPAQIVGFFQLTAFARALDGEGNLLFAAGDGALQIVRVNSPGNLERIGRLEVGVSGFDVAHAGDMLWLAGTNGLQAVRITDPTRPQLVSTTPLAGGALGEFIRVQGNRAYVLGDALYIFDISNPTAPRLLSRRAVGFELRRMVLDADDMLYLVESAGRLHMLDTRSTEDAPPLKRFSTGENVVDVVVSDGHAFLADDPGGIEILDVRNPSSPQKIGGISVPGSVLALAGRGKYLFASLSNGVSIFNISNSAAPAFLTNLSGFGVYVGRVSFAGRFGYVASSAGLKTIDVSDPVRFGVVSGQSTFMYDFVAVGDYGFGLWNTTAPGGFYPFDLRVPSSPQLLTALHPNVSASSIAYRDGFVYFPNFIYDVRDPANPKLSGTFPPIALRSMTINGTNLLATGFYENSSLILFDISNPVQPRIIAKSDPVQPTSGDRSVRTVISKGLAFVAKGYGGLEIFEVNPTAASVPSAIGQAVDTAGASLRQIVARDFGRYAYLPKGTNGLDIVDLRDESEPKRIGGLAGNSAVAAAIEDNFLYVVGDEPELRTMEISDGATPQLLDRQTLAAPPQSIIVSSERAFVGIASGVLIYDLSFGWSPQFVRRIDLPGPLVSMTAEGTLLAAATTDTNGSQGLLTLIDLENPLRPVTRFDLESHPGAILLQGKRLLAGAIPGIQVIDVSDFEHPFVEELFRLEEMAPAVSLTRSGKFIAAASVRGDLHLFEIGIEGEFRRAGWRGLAAARPELIAIKGPFLRLVDKAGYLSTLRLQPAALAAPALSLHRQANGQRFVRWPAEFQGFHLETNSEVTGLWETTTVPYTDGLFNRIPFGDAPRFFYRLKDN